MLKDLDIEFPSGEFHRSLPTAIVVYNLPEGHRRGEDYHGLGVSDLVTCTIHLKKPMILESPPFQRFWNSECGSEMDKSNATELENAAIR